MESQTILNGGVNSLGFMGQQNINIQTTSNVPYEVIHLKEEEMIFKEGDTPKGLYYVQSGCVKVVVNRSHARGRTTTNEYVTKLVSPGEYFGYKALVKGATAQCHAKAVKSTVLWLYPRELIQVAMAQASPMVKLLLNQSVNDLEAFENTSQLHYLASVQERIAYQLVILADRFGTQTPNGISLNLKLTRNEFAQLASTINESLSRHLTEFKNEGLIDLNGKEIIIKNRDGLMRRSGNF
ncbi:Crp/Fnr family transcriptional regulator [Bdellovibrio sp. HCB185ZH]|uniref:Crp/Fnr family transcriptional regulator n=1 Tax=Bdellovibrio TaxID=958 RepID=UPI001157FF2A|nr:MULTISPECIES: Crp/Fnr family transcriptional regulator [unclassified Bdellovibrio]QDK44023.1 Crp/Fnr family transcriptional regulator [Bdellovibrio sp. ZAP7]QLY25863.1 Crp/Fnr family transcriptional regulator [Bdellovibrio sp. KM01]